MVLRLLIPRWHPATINELLRGVKTRIRLKKVDRNIICTYCFYHRIPVATGQRRVDLLITLGPRQKGADPDAFWKSLNDALVQAKLLVDDSRRWVQLGSVTFERGAERATTITLTDLDGEQA